MSGSETVSNEIVFLDQIVVEDIRNLCKLTAETGYFSTDEVEIVEELAWTAIKEGEESGYSFLLAVPDRDDRSHPLGFACFGPIPCTTGSWDLYWIVVDRQMQGRGYGRTISREVENRVLLQCGRKLFLETSSREQYSSTRGFYEACGYGLEARMVDYYAQDEDCLVYSKKLK